MTEANDIQQTKYDYIISSAPLGKLRSTADILYNLALSSTIQHLISWRRSFGHTRHAYICSLPFPGQRRRLIIADPCCACVYVVLQKDGKDISPWHDIPLKAADGTFNFITEIPK